MTSDGWAIARSAADRAGVSLRPLVTVADAEAVIEVMIATWGHHQLVPSETIVALAESGNLPLGALEDARLIAFVLGWAGVDADGVHMHSHMLAALPQRRHKGVGFALKLAQRAQCLDQGIQVIRWTFDPMIARNAWLNIGKLGAVADRFERKFYGEMTDTINAGERTDRLVVRWRLDRPPGLPRPMPGDATHVRIPRDYSIVRRQDPELARTIRDQTAEALEEGLGRGLVVTSFDPDTSTYGLTAQ